MVVRRNIPSHDSVIPSLIIGLNDGLLPINAGSHRTRRGQGQTLRRKKCKMIGRCVPESRALDVSSR